MTYDVFICHASEDKGFVRPLAKALRKKRLKVWYDEFELKLGDSLIQKIDYGLANSRYGVVVLSEAFFKKNWTKSELDALQSRQNAEGRKVILPIYHNITNEQVAKYSPILASLFAAKSSDGLDAVVKQIMDVCSEKSKTKKHTATSGKSAEKKLKAIDLFGGAEHIKKEMACVIKKSLNEKIRAMQGNRKNFSNAMALSEIADHLKIDRDFLNRIYANKDSYKEMNHKLFGLLEFALNISIADVLGYPDFSNDKIEQYWMDECLKLPLFPHGTLASTDKSNDIGSVTRINIAQQKLKLYVTLQAIYEISQGEI